MSLAAVIAMAAPIEPGAIEVIDGDTISVRGAVVRLVGFDTPETGDRARCDAERSKGRAATNRLRALVSAGGLDFVMVQCSCRAGTEGTQLCNYGRACGTLTARGRDVGAILIRENLAREYRCGSDRCPPPQPWC